MKNAETRADTDKPRGTLQAESRFDTESTGGLADLRIDTDVPNGLTALCDNIRSLQRQRVQCMEARKAIRNRLNATVRLTLGYHAGLDEKERKAAVKEADAIIDAVFKGDTAAANGTGELILNTQMAFQGFTKQENGYYQAMQKLAKELPVAPWVELPQQRGFGIGSLATLVGEAGNLDNYEAPGKLWRRFGLWPIEKGGLVHMPSRWKQRQRQNPHLTAAEWEEAGYCPRRRSIAYLFGEGLVKQNKSIYRARYDQQREKKEGLDGWPPIRCHRHAMTLATKLLMKHLWAEWTGTLLRDA